MSVSLAPTALPRRFRRLRVLLIGCGDVGLRVLNQYAQRASIRALARREEQCTAIRQRGGHAVLFDLDAPGSRRLPESLAARSIYLAPPSEDGADHRLRRSLARSGRPARFSRFVWDKSDMPAKMRLMYTSTSGVFGDAGGKLLTETSTARPTSARAQRRLSAERLLRHQTAQAGYLLASLFRVPGIYAADRLPRQRLENGTPAISAEQDSYSNHIHANDLARLLWLGLFRARANRLYIASDGQNLKMGDYFDQVADALALPRPPRLPAHQVREQVSPMMWSFMAESRRLSNARLLRELRITLDFPSVAATLQTI